ncbi:MULTISPECIES: hypothetical protein [Streptomyces]|uniref:Lipoprotein n=2 Tax=Streptomyces TaxID=1883 RepID=A0A2U9NUK8_STRAS|nr:hypothetical protein [Streptomyces actuosus]AWT40953.1 hypothetical protein DMT42_00385 [Streptomyces actuosus]MBM4826573.1 hypothetical protein [Streptomyces actuosus]
MTTSAKSDRHRPGTLLRTTLISASTALLALLLTACNGDGTSKAASPDGTTPTATAADSDPGTASPTAGAKPAAPPASKPADVGGGASPSTAPKPVASTPAPGKPLASATAADDGCDHKMPISPDEVAVYRYTPEGGFLSLIVKYGNWGCAPKDSDGAPFETVGKETYMPMDQAAYITVTNPIVAGSENQHIGVQEFLDWLEAHPNSGLVFKYHLGAHGAIDRLDEEFTP